MKTPTIRFILGIGLLSLMSCSVFQKKQINPHVNNTPGTFAINETLLCDQSETSNFNWLEYLYWTGRIYGDSSQIYLDCLPNVELWSEIECLTQYTDYYLRHPAYMNYPVVGITKEQALNFSKWRSDMVFHYILIRDGILDYDTEQTVDHHFSIENYFTGKYPAPNDTIGEIIYIDFKPDLTMPYPVYRLPTFDERQLILAYVDSTESVYRTKKRKKAEEWDEYSRGYQTDIEPCYKDSVTKVKEKPMVHVNFGLPDKHYRFKLVYNTRGNVAEWADEDNITYGGGWRDSLEQVLENDTIRCLKENVWTGFRNVVTWEKWKP
ncbi:MAG: hypothetical protein QNK23_11130 [Crocinitomicaceae bacterium]|nr:hypothetical protein [Crocinitomicaceae bacterium]